MKKDKYLFLDVDGVLNCEYSFKRDCEKRVKSTDIYYDLNKRNLFCLYCFIKEVPNIHIILSSSWRILDNRKQQLKNAFKEFQIPEFEDITPRLNYQRGRTRGNEIQKWMDKNNVQKEQIVIFDDESDMGHLKDRLVQTNFFYPNRHKSLHFDYGECQGGLCYRHILKAWKLLEENC